MTHQPEVVRHNLLTCQVCVPHDWEQKAIEDFANSANPCGTKNGWIMRTTPFVGDKVRQPCAKHKGFVHVVLEA